MAEEKNEEERHPINLNVDANLYAITNVQIIPQDEQFLIMIFSGNQVRQFMATPRHAKRIMMLLRQSVENYEKQFGDLKTDLPSVPQQGSSKKEGGFGFGEK